jgi:hypothetical protein
LSKKRDALRRGIRDLIEDTSRDLVAFEGREPRPYRDRASQEHRPEAAGPATAGAETRRMENAPAAPHADAPALNGGPVERVGDATPGEAAPVETGPERSAVPESAPFELIADTVFLPPTAQPSEPPKPPRAAAKPASGKKSKPGQRAPVRKGRRRAQAARPAAADAAAVPDDVGADSVRPIQAESRTGVCRSYFTNHECWRVPNAYCNTALQVCVIRNCPVYHLHKDALEHRFAKKFKHLW